MTHFAKALCVIATVCKISALMSAPKQTTRAFIAEVHVIPTMFGLHETACLLILFSRADITFSVMQQRCQRSRAVMCPQWSNLAEFVLTVDLRDNSRPGCWSCLCRPPFSSMSVSSFEPPSLEISSSSHHSWRLLLLFKPPPFLCAASFLLVRSLEFLVFGVLLIVLWTW